jgi:hypothetical protein
LLATYVALVFASIGWTASCPSCESTFMGEDMARGGDIVFVVFWGLYVGLPVLAITWLSARLSRWVFSRRTNRV